MAGSKAVKFHNYPFQPKKEAPSAAARGPFKPPRHRERVKTARPPPCEAAGTPAGLADPHRSGLLLADGAPETRPNASAEPGSRRCRTSAFSQMSGTFSSHGQKAMEAARSQSENAKKRRDAPLPGGRGCAPRARTRRSGGAADTGQSAGRVSQPSPQHPRGGCRAPITLASSLNSCPGSTGLGVWPFIPVARQRAMSSS